MAMIAQTAKLARLLSTAIVAFLFLSPSNAGAQATGAQAKSRIVDVAQKSHREGSARERFKAAKSFYTYYGAGKTDELSRYDIAILHPRQMPSDDVKALSASGVVTVGYITIGEDDELQVGNGQGPGGKASWYFDRDEDDAPDQDSIWKSWYANTNDPIWRANRVAEAQRLVGDYGFDGIFLDLISVSELYPECREGMRQMMRDLREALPDAVIVMNQGFDIVEEVAPLADGFMIESFTATYDFETKKYMINDAASLDAHLRRAKNILNPAVRTNPLRVLVLDYAGPTDHEAMQLAANRAASLNYLFSVSPILLDDVYSTIPDGESDPKWLQMHSSREMLSLTLSKGSNGFPAGTVITPSGCFPGYTVEPLMMPAENRAGLHWSKLAWASAEDGDDAWLEFRLPEEREGGMLSIYWNDYAGLSRQFSIQVRRRSADSWDEVDGVAHNKLLNTTHNLPRTPFEYIRIFQPPDGGSKDRPRLMWIDRVEISD